MPRRGVVSSNNRVLLLEVEKNITVVTENIETKLLKNGMLKLKIMPFALEFLLFSYAQIKEL
jgi:hypothetical protein